jgi:hypothetical protein
MSESDRIANLRRRTQFAFQRDAPAYKQPKSEDASSIMQLAAGAVDSSPMLFSSTVDILQANLLEALDALFHKVAQTNLGPTKSSRIFYLWFATIAQAWNWVTKSAPFSGVKDNWDWSASTPLTSLPEQTAWMTVTLQSIMSAFVPGFNMSSILERERTAFGWTAPDQAEIHIQVSARANRSVWQAAWSTWFAGRAADGNVAASTVPDAATAYPNGTTRLDVADTVDPTTYPHPESWTPLKIGAALQNYMTMNWKDVRSTVLNADQESELATLAASFFPDTDQRAVEIAEVVAITASLTDLEKVTAEFWAGGPYTVSPPGMCMWLWKAYMRAFLHGNTTFIYSGHDLALHLFETGRIVWGLKKQYEQARPIQEIRRAFRGQTLTKYDGTPLIGESWVPYQESNFVTPPFPDFPSGHSAFSQSFANVMTSWFGPSIQNKAPYSYPDLALLSPAFKAAQTLNYGSFVFPAGASLIQPGVVPAVPIILTWPTWQALANSAGLSRKYGGIHATSAHTSSQAVANRLHAILQSHYSVG